MKVAIQARLKNGILYEAAKKLGSQSALARYLGLTPMEVGAWINFQRTPHSVTTYHRRSEEFWQDIENKLFALTGHTLEEIFPPELATEAFLKRQKRIEAIVEMPVEQLLAAGAVPQLLPAPDDALLHKETTEIVDYVLDTLKPNYKQVLELRYGLDGGGERTLAEVGKIMGVGPERVRQIEVSALRKLRHPSREKILKQVL